MTERRRVSANILWLAGEKSLRLAVGFILLGLIARHLGPESFGALNCSAGLAAVFAVFASLGLDSVVVRELVRTPDQSATILGTAFGLRLLGAAFAIASLAILGPWLATGDEAFRSLVAIASLALLWPAFDVIDLWFQKNLRSRQTVIAKIIALALGSGVRIWLLAQAAPVAWFCWALVLDGLWGALALAYIYSRDAGRIARWRFAGSMARTLIGAAWPLVTSGLLIAVYLRLDQVLVLTLLGPRELGFYTAAGRVSELSMTLAAFVLTSVFPLLAARHARDKAAFQVDLQFAFDALTALGYAFAVSVSVTAPFLVPLVFGENYRPAGRILAVLAWSAPFLCSGGIRAHHFLLDDATIYHNWAAALGIAANVALGLALIPPLGGTGAALAVVISAAISAWLSSFLFPRLRACGRMQTAALLLPLRPSVWPGFLRRLR